MVDQETKWHVLFRYDAKNRLEYRITNYGDVLAPSIKVIYDARGRASQYIAVSNYNVGDYFWEWHFLSYDSRNNIVRDTTYYEGTIGPNGPVYGPGELPEDYMYTSTFEYDAENRLIKMDNQIAGIKTYTYNADGNLTKDVHGTPLTYDDHVNWNRTDPFLQFINRDYSRNSTAGATSFNKYGLPLEYPYLGHLQYQLFIDGFGFFNPHFTYSCNP